MRCARALLLGVLALLVADVLAGAGSLRADEPELIRLRFDPFAAPGSTGKARAGASVAAVWSPVLRATLVDGDRSLADLGGIILRVGEEAHGYRLLEVEEWQAVFEKNGARVVLDLAPRGSGSP